jgi:hypothetical protein
MRQKEHIEAKALMRWVGLKTPQYPDLAKLFHIPNGGDRHRVVAAKLKAEGVKAGVSDYFLPVGVPHRPAGEFLPLFRGGLFLELKALGDTRPTPAQLAFLKEKRADAYAATWCRGWEAAAQALLAYLHGEEIPLDWRKYDGGRNIHL